MIAMKFTVARGCSVPTWSKRSTAMGSSVGGSRWEWPDGGEAGARCLRHVRLLLYIMYIIGVRDVVLPPCTVLVWRSLSWRICVGQGTCWTVSMRGRWMSRRWRVPR